MDTNEALLKLGFFKKWQTTNYMMLSLSVMFPPAWHIIANVYTAFKPEHHCRVPQELPLNQSIPMENGQLSSCLMYKNFSVNAETMPCNNGWTYLGDHGPTIVTQWDLVCDSSHLGQTPQTFFLVGSIFGSLVFAKISDHYGRKLVFLILHWATVVIGSASVFISNFTFFCVMMFFLGATANSIIVVGFIFTCESFAAPHRTFVGTIIENCWGLAFATMPLFAYFLRNWVYLRLFISLSSLLTIPLYWLLPESLIWLEMKGRTEEAEKILQRAARMNKIDLPNPMLHHPTKEIGLENKTENKVKKFNFQNVTHSFKNVFKKDSEDKRKEQNDKHNYAVSRLFTNRTLRKHLLLDSLMWLSVIMVYYAFSFTTALLAGNHYLNGFLSAIIELPSYIFSYFLMKKFGRRYPIIGYQMLAGVSLIMQVVVGKVNFGSHVKSEVLVVVFNMIGKFGISGAYGSLDLFSPELFPTSLRSQAQGIASVFGKLGTILSAFLPFLLEKNDWLPLIILAGMLIFGCSFVFMLPETAFRTLPHTIEDIESWYVPVPSKKGVEETHF